MDQTDKPRASFILMQELAAPKVTLTLGVFASYTFFNSISSEVCGDRKAPDPVPNKESSVDRLDTEQQDRPTQLIR
jgi:hypothetical protein